MRSIAHIVNPVRVDPSSDLWVAQPVTFASMRRAAAEVEGTLDVSLFSTQYPEDHSVIPDFVEKTSDLDRSVLDFRSFAKQRKLPLLQDVLGRLYEASNADYFVYTNVDIALMPSFYQVVDRLIDQGLDAFSVTRRTIGIRYTDPSELALMYAQVGSAHPGTDCFVFPRAFYPQLRLSESCLGAEFIAMNLQLNLLCLARNYQKLRDLHLTFHLGDRRAWRSPSAVEFARYNAKALGRTLDCLESEGRLPDRLGFGEYLSKVLTWQERRWRWPLLDRLLAGWGEIRRRTDRRVPGPL
jgi:hypothetical protein